MKKCFECGSVGRLHNHHVIPRVLSGKSTVALCESCHGLIHNLNFRDHGNLIKMGLENCKENGATLGRPKGTTISNSDLISKHEDIISCLEKGMSVRKTAKATNKSGSTVQRIKKIL